MPDAANVPALGLSNKAITSDAPAGNPYDPSFTPSATATAPAAGTSASILDGLPHPPLEDHLCRHTLWPEHEKLYGHGYEISALAASPDSRIIATAAKASTAEHAVIRLFETHGWRELKPSLPAHALTVTALSFSDDSRRLLSVGRDRAWAVFENRADAWQLVERRDKAHTRMVLGAGWAPGGGAFATAGRDKCVKVWQRGPEDSGYVCVCTVKFEMPVTAVDYLGCAVGGKTWLAVGEESGALWLYAAGEDEAGKVELVRRLDDRLVIHSTLSTPLHSTPLHSHALSFPRMACPTNALQNHPRQSGHADCVAACAGGWGPARDGRVERGRVGARVCV